jgi:outer membrane immunogenic protein
LEQQGIGEIFMMRFLLAIVLLALAGPAVAADMPVKAPLAVKMANNWSGFYIGGSVGALVGSTDGSFVNPPLATWHIDDQSVLVDGHVGLQYQFASMFVLGVEGDFINHFNSSGTADSCHPPAACAAGSTLNGRLVDNMWTVGGRAGLVSGASIFYVSGGYAGGAKLDNFINSPPGVLFESTRSTHNGNYIGAGFDWMVFQGLIAGAEYRHYEFGSQTVVPTLAARGLPNAFDTWTLKPKADTFSVRLSWLFGWVGGGPVMTKY